MKKKTNIRKLEKALLHKTGRAIDDYGLIRHGDSVLVGLSGGKDSWTLLHLLSILQKKAPVRFSLTAFAIDQGFPGFDARPIQEYIHSALPHIPCIIYHADIPRIVREKQSGSSTMCSFCSRLRRGIIYRMARAHRCNKIALAHHADDFIETFMLNILFSGSVKAMAPILAADDGINTIIRPLCYADEQLTADFAQLMNFPIISPGCPVNTGSDSRRKQVKKLLAELEASHPGVKHSLLSSLSHVKTRHLMDCRYLKTHTSTVTCSK